MTETTTTYKCRSCGEEDTIRAWYRQDACQGIEIHGVNEDGTIAFDYDGCDDTADDAGDDFEYRCRNCDDNSDSLEELVGLPRVGEPTFEVTLSATELSLVRAGLTAHYHNVADQGPMDEEYHATLASITALEHILIAIRGDA